MGDERIAGLLAEAGDDVDDAGGKDVRQALGEGPAPTATCALTA
jgi:hypothetical protein